MNKIAKWLVGVAYMMIRCENKKGVLTNKYIEFMIEVNKACGR